MRVLRRGDRRRFLSTASKPTVKKLGSGGLITQYIVFVSSGDDLIAMRNKVDRLIHNSINPKLLSRGVRFEPDLWERQPPRRLRWWETIDDEFVERACNSDLVLTLLLARLGRGTKKEILAVLKTDVELKALWFIERDERPRTEVARFLRKLADREELRYKRAGKPGSDESHEAITQVLVDAAIDAVTRQPRDLRARP